MTTNSSSVGTNGVRGSIDSAEAKPRASTSADDAARSENEWNELNRAIARLRAGVMAVVFGMVGGVALFSATVWLLLRGGENVGKHLGLLRYYFPGYSVTWPGSLLGLVYGALVGALVGWLVSWIYNLVASRRHPE